MVVAKTDLAPEVSVLEAFHGSSVISDFSLLGSFATVRARGKLTCVLVHTGGVAGRRLDIDGVRLLLWLVWLRVVWHAGMMLVLLV